MDSYRGEGHLLGRRFVGDHRPAGDAETHGFSPYFRCIDGATDAVVTVEGRERIMLGSNNYLGLSDDERIRRAARDALDRYGTALTGSRLLNGTTALHQELEHELADWLDTEAALVFTTGYQANIGCLSALLQPSDYLICDSAIHASILDGCALSGATLRSFRHGRLDKLEGVLQRLAAKGGGGLLVAVEGIYSMEGDVTDLPTAVGSARRYGARVMVDEAHSIGVLGPQGAGACADFGVQDEVDVRMGTFSKSLASCGGFIAGSRALINHLRLEARSFLFTAAAVPAALGAALAAVRVCRSEEGGCRLERLRGNAERLRSGLRESGIDVAEPSCAGRSIQTPIIAITVDDGLIGALLWRSLWDAGYYVNMAVYPAITSRKAVIRASVTSEHRPEHIDGAVSAIARLLPEAEALARDDRIRGLFRKEHHGTA